MALGTGCLLFFFISILLCFRVCGDLVPSERKALEDLFESTSGPSHWSATFAQSWNIGDPCINKWIGVKCNDGNNHVEELNLANAGLLGSLRDSLEEFKNLKKLYEIS